LPTPGNVRLRRVVRQLDEIIYGFIRRRRCGTVSDRATTAERKDLLSILLHARDEGGGRMTDRQLRDEAMTLFLAGHETTALTLSRRWYLLARHPRAEAELVSEWRSVLGGRTPTADDLHRLPYTEAVITEAMRVFPPVYLI